MENAGDQYRAAKPTVYDELGSAGQAPDAIRSASDRFADFGKFGEQSRRVHQVGCLGVRCGETECFDTIIVNTLEIALSPARDFNQKHSDAVRAPEQKFPRCSFR